MFTQLEQNRRALWFPAFGKKHDKTVLFLAGIPSYPKHSDMIKTLQSLGCNVLMPIYSGTFDSTGKFSLASAMNDVNRWYHYLLRQLISTTPNTRHRVRTGEIILFGSSFGALVGGLSLRKFVFPRTKRVVFTSPLWNMTEYHGQRWHQQIVNQTEELVKFAYPNSYRFKSASQFFSQIKGESPVALMRRPIRDRSKMITVISGIDDTVTPPKMAESLALSTAGTLCLIPGGHGHSLETKTFIRLLRTHL
jgi:fermentation-respiration switch protein FrsA (DUF1100 family)